MSDMTVYSIVCLITKYIVDCPSAALWKHVENKLHATVYFENIGIEAVLLYH
jgi:hypothetical protein